MSDSVRPHRRQPTRLCRLWDSPGKNTGVGCHFLLQCMKVESESEVAQSCLTLSDPSLPCSPVAYQVSLSIGFSRHEHWSGVPLLSPYPTRNVNCFPFGDFMEDRDICLICLTILPATSIHLSIHPSNHLFACRSSCCYCC